MQFSEGNALAMGCNKQFFDGMPQRGSQKARPVGIEPTPAGILELHTYHLGKLRSPFTVAPPVQGVRAPARAQIFSLLAMRACIPGDGPYAAPNTFLHNYCTHMFGSPL